MPRSTAPATCAILKDDVWKPFPQVIEDPIECIHVAPHGVFDESIIHAIAAVFDQCVEVDSIHVEIVFLNDAGKFGFHPGRYFGF